MAKAARSLSPKQILERIRQHRHAVIVLARQSARKAIKAQLRAEGLKLSQFSAKDISIRADAYFDVHRERLIAEAEHVIATSPYFARWRCAELSSDAQKEKPPISTTSTVQMSGA
jgi:hypothetical protein